MDLNMPVMNGLEAVKAIRNYEEKHFDVPRTQIVLHSAVTTLQSEIIKEFDGIADKPISLVNLKKLLYELSMIWK